MLLNYSSLSTVQQYTNINAELLSLETPGAILVKYELKYTHFSEEPALEMLLAK